MLYAYPGYVYRPQEGVKIPANDEEAKAEAAAVSSGLTDVDETCRLLLSELPSPSSLSQLLRAVNFDKDVDSHMAVVAAIGNLRARNYAIPEADLHTSK